MQWLLTDGGSLKRPYEPSSYDSHPVKQTATVISDSALLGQPSFTESQANAGVKPQQIVFQPVPEKNPIAVDATELRRSSTGSVAVSGPAIAIKQEARPPPPVLPAVTPSLVPLPVTYATSMLEQRVVGAAMGGLHGVGVNAGGGFVTNAVPLNPSVIQFLQQQQQQPVIQAASVLGTTHNTVNSILAAPKTVSTSDNVNVQMLLNLLNRGANKPAGMGTVQWAPPAHSSSAPPTVPHTQSPPFIVPNFASVAAVPQDLSSQLVFSLSHSTSLTGGSFTAPSVVSHHGMAVPLPAVVSSVLIATPTVTRPQLACHLTDQVLNLTVHSGSQHMDTNVSQSYSGSLAASQVSNFSHVETTAFVASTSEKTPAFCDMAAVSVTPSTYAEPMALATHFPSEAEPPPLKTICMTNTSDDAVNQVLVHQRVSDLPENSLLNAIDTSPPAAIPQPQFAAVEAPPAVALNDAHSFASNVIVHMDVTSSPHPPAKPVQTSATELPHEMNATGIIDGNLEPPSLFLTSSNNPMLAETSSQPRPQNTDDLQSFSSPSLLGMDIGSGQLTGLSVAAEPTTLNVVSLPANDSSANSMSSNLQQSLAELLDLQQQINAGTVPVTQSAPPSAVLDSPLARELPTVPSESMQWVSSTASHGQTTTAELSAESSVVLASANVGTINLLTAAEVLSNATYRPEPNHDVFYSQQPAVVIGSAGNGQETSATGWNQSSYAALASSENATHVEIKQEQLSATGDVMLDLLNTMSTPTAEPQLYTQQTSGEVTSDYFSNCNAATTPVTSSSTLPVHCTANSNSAQPQDIGIVQYAASQQIQPAAVSNVHSPTSGVIYVVNQVGVDNSGSAQEPGSQPITYHIVTANQLPSCNQSAQDIGIVQYAAPAQIQPAAAASEVHSPTSGGFRVLATDTTSAQSTDPAAGGLQFQLSQPMSFGSTLLCCYCCYLHVVLLADTGPQV